MAAFFQGWAAKDILSIAIAAVALMASIASIIISRRGKLAEDNRIVRSQMNDVITRIIDVQSDNQREYWRSVRENNIETWQVQSSNVNQKLMSLARIAVYLEGQTKISASDVEYATIASAMATAGDPLAQTYWEKAVAASPNEIYRVFSMRGCADYLFSQGKPKEGRETYRAALDVLKEDNDFTRYTDGYTHRMWGVSEQSWGTASESRSHFQSAQEKFNEIQREQVRNFALSDLTFVMTQMASVAPRQEQSHPPSLAYDSDRSGSGLTLATTEPANPPPAGPS